MDFIDSRNGIWHEAEWEEFCKMLDEKGYTPIDFDMVGLLMGKKKVEYLANLQINN